MARECKEFVECGICGASVRDCNIGAHMAKAHGIAVVNGIEERVDAKNPSADDRLKLSQIYLEQGQGLFEDGKYKECEAYFEKAIEYDGKNTAAYLSLADAFDRRGHQCSKVESVLRKALESAPGEPEVAHRIADHLMMHGKLKEAINALKASKNARENGKTMEKLAIALMYSGRMDEAKKELVAAWPKLRESFAAGDVDGGLYLHLGSILFTLVATEHGMVLDNDGASIKLNIAKLICNRCLDGTIMEVLGVSEKAGAVVMEAKCGKCHDVAEFSDADAPISFDETGRQPAGKSKNPLVISLDVMRFSEKNAIIEVKFNVRGGDFLTGLAYNGETPQEALELLKKDLAGVSGFAKLAREGQMAVSMGGTTPDAVPGDFIIRNSGNEIELMADYFEGLKTAQGNFRNLSRKEMAVASVNRLDLFDDDLDMDGCDVVQRITICRRLAIAAMAGGEDMRAGDYMRNERMLLDYLYSQKTGYENENTAKLLFLLAMYETDNDETVPETLLLEIIKRRCSRELLEIAQDRERWGVGIWRVATYAMYLVGAIGDAKIIPDFLSAVSSLDSEDLLAEMVCEELPSLLANFGGNGRSGLISALRNEEFGEYLRGAVADALAIIAILYPEGRCEVVRAMREIVSSGAPPTLVSFVACNLCALGDFEALPAIMKAFDEKRADETVVHRKEIEKLMNSTDVGPDCFRHCRHPLELFGIPDFDETALENEA